VSRSTARWRGAVAATPLLVAVGLVTAEPVLLLAGVVPLVYVGYGALSRDATPDPDALVLSRTVEPTPVAPGEAVAVELTVTNEGERALPDLRVVDGVPTALAVVAGSPRLGTTLDAGETATLSYTLVARRGEYEFGPVALRTRGVSAAAVTTREREAAGEDRVVCRLDAGAPPLSERGVGRAGAATAESPGEGIAFHSTREYRPGDPARRIDWRSYAKRDALATVEYERQAAPTAVVVLDARPVNRVVAGPGRPTAVELAAYAATRATTDLLRAGSDVAVAVLGVDGAGPVGLDWLPPGTGADHHERARARLRASVSGRGTATDTGTQVRRLVELAPAGATVALFSPALDDAPVEAVETWRAFDRPVTLLSPAVLATNTPGGRLAGTERHARLAACQAAGARTVDWRRGTPLSVALERAAVLDGQPREQVGRGR
jgi:uncharacterized protein (DUF58 family)